jgi:hypothetical protein
MLFSISHRTACTVAVIYALLGSGCGGQVGHLDGCIHAEHHHAGSDHHDSSDHQCNRAYEWQGTRLA